MFKKAKQTAAPFPPPYLSQPKIQRKLRFIATAPGLGTITRGDLLNFMVGNAASSSTFVRISASVLLTQVQIWGIGTASGHSTVSLEWKGPYLPSTEISDTGNPMRPAHVVGTPPKNSFAELWSCSGFQETDVLFEATLNTGDVLDLHVTYVIADGSAVSVPTGAPAIGPGIFYTSLGTAGNWIPANLIYAGF